MTTDTTTVSDDALSARLHELYPLTQQPGCPRETTLEYFALSDEQRRRRPIDHDVILVSCTLDIDEELEGHEEQP